MPLYRAQVSRAIDTNLAVDKFVNVLYFNDQGLGTNPDNLAADLLAIFNGLQSTIGEAEVRLYDMADAAPRPIKGRAISSVGTARQLSYPGEVCLCLSYYAGRNLKRLRGRIYLPLMGLTTDPSDRPTLSMQQALLDLATSFSNLGGADVDWQVYSTLDGVGRNVTNAWVDNEWDTQRSRGKTANSRVTRAISE